VFRLRNKSTSSRGGAPEEALVRQGSFDRVASAKVQWLNSIVDQSFATYGYEAGSNPVIDPEQFGRIRGERLAQIIRDLVAKDIPVGTTLATYDVVAQKLFDQEAFLSRAENNYLPAGLIEAVVKGKDRHQLLIQELGENAAAWNWKNDLPVQFALKNVVRRVVRFIS